MSFLLCNMPCYTIQYIWVTKLLISHEVVSCTKHNYMTSRMKPSSGLYYSYTRFKSLSLSLQSLLAITVPHHKTSVNIVCLLLSVFSLARTPFVQSFNSPFVLISQQSGLKSFDLAENLELVLQETSTWNWRHYFFLLFFIWQQEVLGV